MKESDETTAGRWERMTEKKENVQRDKNIDPKEREKAGICKESRCRSKDHAGFYEP